MSRFFQTLTLTIACTLLWAQLALAQQGGYGRTYPQAVQQQYMSDCLRQTTQEKLPVSQQVARNYCGCMFGYLQQRVPYNTYQRYDRMVREGKGQQIDPQFRSVFQQGAMQCIRQFVPGAPGLQ
jgi:hypothetical protein